MEERTLTVDASDPIPAYEQLRRQFEGMIASGVLSPGERLPPLRQLAGDLGLAVGTVARTYRILEDARLVISRRGAGTKVAANVVKLTDGQIDETLSRHATTYLRQAQAIGASHEQILSALTRALQA